MINNKQYRVLFHSTIALTLTVFVVSCNRPRHLVIPESTTVPLPNGNREVTFTRLGTHPFSSQYSRTLKLGNENATLHSLTNNTGWETHLNFYWIQHGDKEFLRVEDWGDEYLLDIQTDTLFLVITFKGKDFVAKLESVTPEISGGGPPDNPSAAQIFVDGVLAIPLEPIIAKSEGTYIGAISGATNNLRFSSARERPVRAVKRFRN